MNGIKKRLKKIKDKWVKELLNVLWTYRITPQKATNETLYALAFEFKVIILLEVSLSTTQFEAYDVNLNAKVLARDLNLVGERKKMH